MESQDKICRLCLNINHSKFSDIEENIKKRLNVLLLEINLDVSEKPMLCTNCAAVLHKYYNFKTTCLATIESIIAFVNEDDAKLDLKDIYLSIKGNENVECATADYNICCFCMGVLKNCAFVSLEQEDVISEKIMIEKCLSELDISIIKKPAICVPCHGYLQDYFMFMANCVMVEETIKKYCENGGTNNRDQIELIDVLESSLKNILKENGDIVNLIKKDQQHERIWTERASENCIEKYQEFQLENAFVKEGVNKFEIIKMEKEFCDDMEITETEVDNKHEDFLKIEKFDGVLLSNNTLMYREEPHSIKTEEFWEESDIKVEPTTDYFMEVENKKCVPRDNDEIEIKTEQHDFESFQDDVDLSQLSKCYDIPHTSTNKIAADVKNHQCTSCLYQTNRKSHLTSHSLLHKNPSETPIHKCEFCSYQSKHRYYLTKHLLVHKQSPEIKMLKCKSCSYQTKFSSNLKKHLRVHKDPSVITMYKCEHCPFQTKHRTSHRLHSIAHKNSSDITMYKCKSCSFQTKRKKALVIHNFTHKNPAEVIYQCDSCSFMTKYKSRLHVHMMTHKAASETTMYQGNSCIGSYQSTNKYYKTGHLLVHKDHSQVNMFRCKSCSYQTKTSFNLKKHSRVHTWEVTMYKCEHCPFQTKNKKLHYQHGIAHKNSSEITKYKCDKCSFYSEISATRRNHMLVHMDPSEMTMFKCDSCSYQTKVGVNLRRHLLVHKDPSDITMYKCQFCTFQTKRKRALDMHNITHMNSSETIIYKCESCSFQTKHKSSIRRHMLLHKG